MRVSIDCRCIRERPSGIGAYTRALIDRVPALAPDDHFHLWADPRAQQPLCDAPNVDQTVVRAGANGLRTLLFPARLVDLSGVDVLHAPFNILGRGLRCPCVVTVHDLMWVVRPDLCEGVSPATPFKAAYYRLGIMRALRQAARLIAISQATADSVVLLAPEASRRLRVIPHGVEERFQPPADREAARAHLREHLRLARPYLLVIGQNAPSKNHLAVLRAFAAARFDQPVELLMLQRLYGGGLRLTYGVDRLDRRAQDLGIADRVRFICRQGDDDVLKLLQGALALVQFSRFEGFGMPALEAMACGTPVIASDIPPLVEVCGGAALHVPLNERALAGALERIVAEPGLREELSGRGIERSRAFCWDRCAAAHLEVYREAAAQ